MYCAAFSVFLFSSFFLLCVGGMCGYVLEMSVKVNAVVCVCAFAQKGSDVYITANGWDHFYFQESKKIYSPYSSHSLYSSLTHTHTHTHTHTTKVKHIAVHAHSLQLTVRVSRYTAFLSVWGFSSVLCLCSFPCCFMWIITMCRWAVKVSFPLLLKTPVSRWVIYIAADI